jgi:hypothetical protein
MTFGFNVLKLLTSAVSVGSAIIFSSSGSAKPVERQYYKFTPEINLPSGFYHSSTLSLSASLAGSTDDIYFYIYEDPAAQMPLSYFSFKLN